MIDSESGQNHGFAGAVLDEAGTFICDGLGVVEFGQAVHV